jgi:hypothetical protein
MAIVRRVGLVLALGMIGWWALAADAPPGERGSLATLQIEHEQIAAGELTPAQIRDAGMRVFTMPFNRLDGYGDGPMNLDDTVSPGGRPTLGGNGTLLRVNGLDAQGCLECHAIVSHATVPPTLGIGGVGGSVTNAMIKPSAMDPADLEDLDSSAGFNGRFANPPFLFGAGGVELVGLEMTRDLQQLRQWAVDHPGLEVQLVTKGISFGTIVADFQGEVDYSNLQGVDPDLVVKPFGRKGEFATTRDFDIEAMQFHFGMQPVEVVGQDVDADGDGVVNEITVGHLSALQVFATSMPRPVRRSLGQAATRGFDKFQEIGCTSCHVPELNTRSVELPLRFPADPVAPESNVYYRVDLSRHPTGFDRNDQGGVVVPLFADLKRHDMGEGLAESFFLADDQRNREFTTARLWGIADTAPYLHDGRATTLTDAILWHGGEAQQARDGFAALSDGEREDLLAFLRSLHTPDERPPQQTPRPRRADSPTGIGRSADSESYDRYD